MKRFFILMGIMSLVMTPAEARSLPPLPEGPLLLTSTTPEMLHPEYWIRRLPNPDALIKTPEELEQFNREIRAIVPDRVDVFNIPESRLGRPVREQLELEYKTLKGRIFFGEDGQSIQKSLFENTLKPRIQAGSVPKWIRVRWGAAAQSTSVRALPTDVMMLEERGDIEFDQLQFTRIKVWTPVAVLHESSDGQWYYVQAPYSRGWVKSKDIALFPNASELEKYARPENPTSFLVVTGERAVIFSDSAMQESRQSASMGALLPVAGENESTFMIWLPLRGAGGEVSLGKAFVSKKSDVHIGFLPYTQANIIRQAFKLLGARYGWGGTYHGRDCSGFTHDVFLSVGIDMPRNSREQAFVGTQLGHFVPFEDGPERVAAIRAGLPGITLLRMPLHLMLYLGEVNGHFYIIHSTWAERISMDSDLKNRVNQVVVTDLSLNGNSYLGSLFNRIESVNEVN